MITINNETYITVEKAAELTGYNSSYIGRLAADGKIQATKIGRAWAVSKQSVLAYGSKPKNTTRNFIRLRLKAMQLGHKMIKSPDGRVYCTKCQETVTVIAKGNMKCE